MIPITIPITKSSRHQKIVGDFGERLVCNWLSRSGFEVFVVDHTGMDIIASRRHSKHRLGITVKSRTRASGMEFESVNLFKTAKGDRQKLQEACETFGCEPWIAIYVECVEAADLFLTSLSNYDKKYGTKRRVIDDWKMTEKQKREYRLDTEVQHIEIRFNPENWRLP